MRRIFAILSVLAVTTALHGVSSAGAATDRDPGELWNAFPLERAPQAPPNPFGPSVTAIPPSADGSGSTGSDGDRARLTIIFAVVVAGIALGPAAVVLLGRRRRRDATSMESDQVAIPHETPKPRDVAAPAEDTTLVTANWPVPTAPLPSGDEVAEREVVIPIRNDDEADRPPADTPDTSGTEDERQRVIIPIRTPAPTPAGRVDPDPETGTDPGRPEIPTRDEAVSRNRANDAGPPRAGGIRDLGRPTICVIDWWWAGGEESYFYARVDGPSGGPVAVTRSSTFPWEGPGEPPQRHDTSVAYREIVRTLLDLGWTPNGTGTGWFQTEFRSPEARTTAPTPRVVIRTVDGTD